MSANVDAMVRAGVDAYRAGNKAEARTLLERAIELDGYNETAWLWLSAVVDTPEEQQTCLENVLVINPVNERARQGLKSLGIDPDSIAGAETSAPAFAEGTFDEYDVPSSSASVEYAGPETSAEEYDDWVGGLNLNTDTQASTTPSASEDLFGDIDFSADASDVGGAFDLDDNIFSEDAYSGYEDDALADSDAGIDEELFDDDALFDDGDDMYADIGTFEDFNEAVGGTDDYNASAFDDDPFAPAPVQAEPESVTSEAALFALIPAEIEATRAPGLSEKSSPIHYIIIGILVLVNIGGLAFVGMQLIG